MHLQHMSVDSGVANLECKDFFAKVLPDKIKMSSTGINIKAAMTV